MFKIFAFCRATYEISYFHAQQVKISDDIVSFSLNMYGPWPTGDSSSFIVRPFGFIRKVKLLKLHL